MDAITALLHPHHVSLQKNYTSLHLLHQHIEDPFYGLDRHPSYKNVAVAHFDIRETPDAFYLDGEFPGLTNLEDVVCEFIGNQTLIVRADTKPIFLPGGMETIDAETKGIASSGSATSWRLKERRVGKFERSFTFSTRIIPAKLRTTLEAGVISIVLPKDKNADQKEAAKSAIASEQA